jgi:hypothetical protein
MGPRGIRAHPAVGGSPRLLCDHRADRQHLVRAGGTGSRSHAARDANGLARRRCRTTVYTAGSPCGVGSRCTQCLGTPQARRPNAPSGPHFEQSSTSVPSSRSRSAFVPAGWRVARTGVPRCLPLSRPLRLAVRRGLPLRQLRGGTLASSRSIPTSTARSYGSSWRQSRARQRTRLDVPVELADAVGAIAVRERQYVEKLRTRSRTEGVEPLPKETRA